jgi:hypothetical protein
MSPRLTCQAAEGLIDASAAGTEGGATAGAERWKTHEA